MEDGCGINPGKYEFVEYKGKRFACYAVHTSVVTKDDNIYDIIERYAEPNVRRGDIIFISEKMIACAQGRAYPLDSIKPGFLAKMLSRFVTKSPYGIGLSIPETMQCAISEAGILRILLAAFAGAVGRALHKKGWFYRVAGKKVAAIDGPCSYTLPPYNRYVVLSPSDPDRTAREISQMLMGNTVLIIDANDIGCEILGASDKLPDRDMYAALLRQNPLGQGTQCTPIGILRLVWERDTM